ncbi:helix-turn-helix transcriptional regulator [Acanthopleuribacter pedis]|uniref:Helix-turn-helix domain-containing protein n=1 Tax=Acanthopleuribacter pedis TaxID=442870 RepID=A0A8J7Q8T3_9BACT|nr:hypothetical protein [Acanthopleuribacter pedis]MBO1319539.1 hypothetical protein [Acanthopleuribacter pedis]
MTHHTNYVLKNILVTAILQAKLLSSAQEIDTLITATLEQFQRASTAQDQLLTEQEVASRWQFLDERKLRNMRYLNKGPTYYKFGKGRNGRIYYKPSDIEAWITEHEHLEPFLQQTIADSIHQTLSKVRQ